MKLAEVETGMMEFFETYSQAQRARMAWSLLYLIQNYRYAAHEGLKNLEANFPQVDWQRRYNVHIESMDRLLEEAQRAVARAADDE